MRKVGAPLINTRHHQSRCSAVSRECQTRQQVTTPNAEYLRRTYVVPTKHECKTNVRKAIVSRLRMTTCETRLRLCNRGQSERYDYARE